VTRGPCATNASIAVHSAKYDSVPLVLLVGQVARSARGAAPNRARAGVRKLSLDDAGQSAAPSGNDAIYRNATPPSTATAFGMMMGIAALNPSYKPEQCGTDGWV